MTTLRNPSMKSRTIKIMVMALIFILSFGTPGEARSSGGSHHHKNVIPKTGKIQGGGGAHHKGGKRNDAGN